LKTSAEKNTDTLKSKEKGMNAKDSYAHLTWTEVSRERVLKTPIFNVCTVRRESAAKKNAAFTLLECGDWVNIIPLLKNEAGEDCFLMVRQYRQGSEALTLEFPGGLVDLGESPREAAERELREETGYEAETVFLAGEVNPNPAFMANRCSTFIAAGLRKTMAQDLDENELVDYELVPAAELEKNMGAGVYNHAIMVVAYFWYQKWKKSLSPPAV
jgi:8-oxo-dGTP pyrophosphatase MutT (NUDIX family)